MAIGARGALVDYLRPMTGVLVDVARAGVCVHVKSLRSGEVRRRGCDKGGDYCASPSMSIRAVDGVL